MTGAYRVWLAGASLSLLGTQTLAFAMAWSATSHSGSLAGLVLTMIVAPRVLLALVGGAVADRFGAWRVMITGDAVMLGVTLVLAGLVSAVGDHPAVLVCTALAIGVVDAFYLPSSGSMPRRLVPGAGLARAVSARQICNQVVTFAGAPLGGLLVATAGLTAAAAVDAATFAVMLGILLALRGRCAGTGADTAAGAPTSGLWRQAGEGIAVAARDPLLRPALLLAGAAAAFLLPMAGLMVPLLAHQRLWTAGISGIVVGSIAAGTAAGTLVVLARGAGSRPGLAAICGLLVASGGIGGLAVGSGAVGGIVAGALTGLGTGLFTAHLGPLLLGHAPPGHLARVQAVVLLVQSVPLLATNNLLGFLADEIAPGILVGTCGIALAAAALTALRSPALRRAGVAVETDVPHAAAVR